MSTETKLQEKYRRLVNRAETEAIRRGEDYEDWVYDVTAGNEALTRLAKFLGDAFICDDHFTIKWSIRRLAEYDGFSDEEKKQVEKLVTCCNLFFELGSIVLDQAEQFIGKAAVICQGCGIQEGDGRESNSHEVQS